MKHRSALALSSAVMATTLGLAACGSSGGSTSASADPNAMASVNVGIDLSPPKAIFFGP